MFRPFVAMLLALLFTATCAFCAMAQDEAAPAAPALSAPDAVAAPFAIVVCPDCAAAGALCDKCNAQAQAFITNMASAMCGNCTPDQPCDECQASIAGAMALLPSLEVRSEHAEPLPVAYLATTVSEDTGATFGQLMQEAGKQNLFTANVQVLCVYPDVMAQGYNDATAFYACVSLPDGVQPAEPLQEYTVPGGQYVIVNHWGDYNKLGLSWLAALAYADLRGISLGLGPASERYVSDPTSVPVEQCLTEIYLPQAAEPTPAETTPAESTSRTAS